MEIKISEHVRERAKTLAALQVTSWQALEEEWRALLKPYGLEVLPYTDPFWQECERQCDGSFFIAVRCSRCGEQWGQYLDMPTVGHVCKIGDRNL